MKTTSNEKSGSCDATCSRPPVSGSVDLCLRIMVKAAFDYERDQTVSEIIETLKLLFSETEIERARELAQRGICPPCPDLSFYDENVTSTGARSVATDEN